eukprot:g5254.t1
MKDGEERSRREQQTQRVLPKLELLQGMFTDTRKGWAEGKKKPIWAFNMLRFRLTPSAREDYYKYGNIAKDVIEKKGTDGTAPKSGEGMLVPPMAARTLAGKVQWDECLVIKYASLSSFLSLTQNKAVEEAHKKHRSKGLLMQGLLLVAPEEEMGECNAAPVLVRSRM